MSIDLYDLDAMRKALRYHADLVNRIEAAGVRGKLADIGAGLGWYASAWRTRTGRSPICVEIEPIFVEALMREGFDVHSTLAALPADLDGAYSINVLEHIEDPVPFLTELRMKMRPGARLYVYVPAFGCLYSDWDKRVGHFRRYRLHELSQSVSASGFTVKDGGYADSLGFLATALLKLTGSAGQAVSPKSVAFYDGYLFPISRQLDRLVGRWFGKNCWIVAEAS